MGPRRSKPPTRAQTQAYTPFRKKYGALEVYKGTNFNKSGLTPTEYIFPSLQRSYTASQIDTIEAVQQDALHGWTTRELADLDCLCIRDAIPGDLDTPIMPIFNRPVWEAVLARPEFTREKMYPLKNGPGLLSAHNDVAWEVLKPALRIATWYLTSAYFLPWFDALLNGPRELVDEKQLPNGYKDEDWFSFRPPDTPTPAATLARTTDAIFEDLRNQKMLQIGFMIRNESPEGPDDSIKGLDGCAGYSTVNYKHMFRAMKNNDTSAAWRVFIWLHSKGVERLLVDNLSNSERYTIEWKIALTDSIINFDDNTKDNADLRNFDRFEPYYLDESLAELGWSFEKQLNGGVEEVMGATEQTLIEGLVLGQFLLSTYPSIKYNTVRDQNTPILKQPPPIFFDIRYPIPISPMENLQTTRFWTTGVRNYGLGLIFIRVFKAGTKTTYNFIQGKIEDEIQSGRDKEPRPASAKNFEQNFRLSVEEMKQAAWLTPGERGIMDFGYDFLRSSNREENFWSNNYEKFTAMKEIIDTIDDIDDIDDKKPSATGEALEKILNRFLSKALQNHGYMITYTFHMEDERESLHTERRESLLRWNRGTQTFVIQMRIELQKMSTPQPQLLAQTERALIRLEKSRLRLANPNPPNATTNTEELQLLRLRRCRQALTNASSVPSQSDLQEMENLVNSILNTNIETREIFEEACAKILIAVLGRNIANSWEPRVREGGKGMEIFEELARTPEGTFPEHDIGKALRDEMNAWVAMLMEVATNGPPAG
ncbi:hypothetical protein HYALB_00002695 [Hymenoscyphus albidus]|uniref:Uncharacterized protein n=1 Tax=Hymenoscyphus albidus TaxID=595503 RepID=A0A9N9M350_9HELO|nr:hypothetical protein HYALB_00002695 [Hymenoscyphus albidus]